MVFGCIFDWDGVIADSSAQHIEAWKILAKEEHLDFREELFKQSFGMKNEQAIPQLFQWTLDFAEIRRLDTMKESIYRELVATRGTGTFPGVKEFLVLLNEQNIPCIIGSSAPRANVTTALDFLGFGEFFCGIVCGDDVTIGKPDPQIFLKAAERLGLDPDACIVFEDAHVGIEAARAGGMKVVAVTTTYPRSQLGDADMIVDRLDELSLIQLTQLVQKQA
jgi:beta-phosphoglucomutase family hydrolase